MENKYLRGSEWRKWDLHVHTPFTKLNNQYKGASDEKQWDMFCEKIEKSDVAVFGITDYFSIENFLLFHKQLKIKYPNSLKVFFPNIEFRIDSKNKSGENIQLHVLFSNDQNVLIKLPEFLIRLKLFSTDDKKLTNKYCTKEDLEEITYSKAMIKIDDLKDQLKSNFSSEDYLIVGLATGYGSLRPGHKDERGSEYAKEIDKICNSFFGNPENVDFYLNKIDSRKQFNLHPKAVISGCDSHSFDEMDKWLGKWIEDGEIKKYITWIKANPTFEGLRQIIYEPEERIKINPIEPDQKDGY